MRLARWSLLSFLMPRAILFAIQPFSKHCAEPCSRVMVPQFTQSLMSCACVTAANRDESLKGLSVNEFAAIFLVACMALGLLLGLVDNYVHRRKIRNASRNKGV
ncbi:hypothetical protein Xtri_23230 [Xanthomonas campestris pv. trichodesmae]|uniref:Uncharacterized protein n=1 Tax=Xanthomonas citri pv. sesbaniae TaxID=473425 RepID=A0AAW4RH85_XANCI|nr:hypothetical protein [Xanthomonas campestris pv. trichodesmae]MBZ3923645.1 hypothetical protein [Xanthomonas citri pv. sesbaniae]